MIQWDGKETLRSECQPCVPKGLIIIRKMTRNKNLIFLLIVLLKGLDSSSYVTNPISILLHTLNSTLYFVNSELKMTEELSKHVFKGSFTFLNSFYWWPSTLQKFKVCLFLHGNIYWWRMFPIRSAKMHKISLLNSINIYENETQVRVGDNLLPFLLIALIPSC